MRAYAKLRGPLLPCLLLPLLAAAPAHSPVTVAKAWVRLPAPGGHMAALYLEAANESDTPETVDAITVSGVASAHVHETFTDPKGMTRMRAAHDVAIPAHKTLSLSPGGLHVMLHGLSTLKPGQTVQGSLRLKSGLTVPFTATTRSAAD